MSLRRSYSFIVIIVPDKTINKSLSQIMATPTVYVPQCKAGWSPNDGQVCKRVGKAAEFGLIWGKGFRKRVAQPHPLFLGVSPGVCSDDYFVLHQRGISTCSPLTQLKFLNTIRKVVPQAYKPTK